jgi:(1->4)-alpha-D-glucan 1-alpha-D-glucosylmutase
MIPRATMRLQFHRGFTFDDAIAVVPYLDALNISHLYASPIMKAHADSMHGYDVVDPTEINPELGGEAAFRRLVAALRQRSLGIMVDIVPNHMAVGGADNPWWLDVLQNGRASPYARYFDIDWEPDDPDLEGKVLVPVLGVPYGAALAKGEIKLAFNEKQGRYEARYFHHVLPIAAKDARGIEKLDDFDPATEAGRQRLHELLERQYFRLAWWRIANDAINWRRFFDINELAALRIEDEAVFEATHAKLFELFAEGLIDGVRIDHVDGLTDPRSYCRRLRSRFETLASQRPPQAPPGAPYIVAEKILGAHEQLPADWGCDGTSGYDFTDQVSRVLHDPRGAEPLAKLWASVSGRPAEFVIEEESSRREILDRSFSAQLLAAVKAIHRFAVAGLSTRDTAQPAIRRALIEILAHMRVYRTYATADEASAADTLYLSHAVEGALRTCLPADRDVVRRLAAWLRGATATGGPQEQHSEAIRRFQQLSAPLAAKAVEDTASYRYGRLLSRTDVGFDPANFADGIAAFHRQTAERAALFPHAMLATATHDHKRGEDIRARLAVLSEMPEVWEDTLRRWLDAATPLFAVVDGKPAPSHGDAAILFQMLVGAWPANLSVEDRKGCGAFAERLAGWQQKALREAKLETDWTAPNEAYETAARNFLMGLFTPEWVGRVAPFAQRIAPAGALNSLTQTLLKLTVPGVPDFYQGSEFWDMSLVDPDNRRPVDFAARARALDEDGSVTSLAAHWRDGRIKQALIRQVLDARRKWPALFADGNYIPIEAQGDAAEHILAFARRHRDTAALVVTSRLCAKLLEGEEIVVPAKRWGDTRLILPAELEARQFHAVLADRTMRIGDRYLLVADILDELPVALLISGKQSVGPP